MSAYEFFMIMYHEESWNDNIEQRIATHRDDTYGTRRSIVDCIRVS